MYGPQIIQSFKRYSTIRYIDLGKQKVVPQFCKKVWQRSYHDRIIRNEQEYQNSGNTSMIIL